MAKWQVGSEDRMFYVFDSEHDNCRDLFVKSRAEATDMAAFLNQYEENYNSLVDTAEAMKKTIKEQEKQIEDLTLALEKQRENS